MKKSLKRKISLLLVALLALTLTLTGIQVPIASAAVVRGLQFIVLSPDGTPLENVQITVEGHGTITTNVGGIANLDVESTTAKSYTVHDPSGNYLDRSGNLSAFDVEDYWDLNGWNMKVYMQATGKQYHSIKVCVDSLTSPLRDAKIFIDAVGDGYTNYMGSTDSSGNYYLAPNGTETKTIVVEASGYAARTKSASLNDTVAGQTVIFMVPSADASLTSIAGHAYGSAGGGDGSASGSAITGSVTVVNAKSSLGRSDIVIPATAAFNLYSDAGFTTEIAGVSTLPLTEGGATTAYIKVTAENGTIKYYAITVNRQGPPSSDASLTSIAGQAYGSAGGGDGSTAGLAITGSITVVNAKSTLGRSDIAIPATATFNLYSDAGFTAEVAGVNTLPLTEGGATTAYIKVTAESTTKKYYAITVNRQAAASDSDGGGYTPSSSKEEITANITNGAADQIVANTTIERVTENGTRKDNVTFEEQKAKQTIEKIKEKQLDVARIVIPDAKDEVAETNVKIPTSALNELAKGEINLEIDTENARIAIPKESIQNVNNSLKEDLYFRVVPIKKEAEKAQLKEKVFKATVVNEAIKDGTLSVIGRPMTIETNMPSMPVDIVLPLKDGAVPTDAQAREEFLEKLAVFIEHSDGEKELVRGEIIEYKPGVFGIRFSIAKFSTFTIIKSDKLQTAFQRLAGPDRIDTALEIAKATYSGKVSNVLLATAENYPDALTGSVLSYKLNAPILLVGNTPEDQQKVLDYLKTNLEVSGTVYIIGNTGAVSGGMEAKAAAGGFSSIKRIGGEDRYETTALVADQLQAPEGTPIVLVSGENYPDALSISSAAAINQYPIFLVGGKTISDPVKNKIAQIKPSKLYIIGLQGAVTTAIENEAAEIASLDKTNIIRIGGTDRFETSLKIAKHFSLNGGNLCIATGNSFPDALAGGVYAAKNQAPTLLVNSVLTNDQINYFKNNVFMKTTIFGGEGAVNNSVLQQLSH